MPRKLITDSEKRDIIWLVESIIDNPLEDYLESRNQKEVRLNLIRYCTNMFKHELFPKLIDKETYKIMEEIHWIKFEGI